MMKNNNLKFIFSISTIFIHVIFFQSFVSAQEAGKDYRKFGQRFICSAGIAYTDVISGALHVPYYDVNISPQINLLNRYSDISVALASHIDGGYHFSGQNSEKSYIINVPAFLVLNFGHLASKNFFSAHGIFFGGGFDFFFRDANHANGVLLTTGLRTWVLNKSITMRYCFVKLNDKDKNIFHSVVLQLNVGRYLRSVHANNKISKFMKPYTK